MRNKAKIEATEITHRYLLNLLTQRIEKAGGTPHFHRRIDLSTQLDNRLYLFKIKSVKRGSVHVNLVHSGMSQLYEYCYLENIPEDKATLVMMAGKPVSTWTKNFLEEDRNIRVLWYDNNELHASARTREELAFLW